MKAAHEPWSIVHIITQLELGGAQLATFAQVSKSQLPWKSRHLLFGPGGLLGDDAQNLEGVECREIPHLVRSISPVNEVRALFEIQGALKEIANRTKSKLVVHTHSSKAGILGRFGAKLAGVEVILHTIHGFGHCHQPNPIFRKLLWGAEKMASQYTQGFTADSEANIFQGIQEALIGPEPTQVVYCPVDREYYGSIDRRSKTVSELRQRLGISENAKVMLNISCLKPQKDVSTYLQVARAVLKVHSDAIFLIAGDGDLRGELENEARALGIMDAVRFLGWRRDIPELLALCDILVLTSLWEGLPQSFGQAMAAGLPIVATRVDGAPEAIVHAVNGFLFEPRDVPGLAMGIGKLLQNDSMRQLMGERAKERSEKFSTEKTISALDEFYRPFVQG